MQKQRCRPLVSVIVPTSNSQKTITQCLDSIKDQTYPRIEMLVVDNHSKDRTVDMASRYRVTFLSFSGGRSEARDYAAGKANGDYLMFVDSDMILTPTVIEECVEKAFREEADAMVVPEKSVAEGLFGRLRQAEKASLSTSRRFIEIPRFVRKSVFLKIGGYDTELTCGEDFDFSRKLQDCKCRISRISAEIIHLEGNPNLYSILSKAYSYGKTLPALTRRRPLDSFERYMNFRLASIGNASASFCGTSELMSFAAIKMFEYMAYLAGFGSELFHASFEKRCLRRLKNAFSKHSLAFVNFSILFLIAVLIFRNYLFTAEWPAGGDVMGFVSRAYLYDQDFRWLYMWRPYSFGFVEGINFMDFFLMTLYWVFKDPSWTVKAFMFLSYLTAGALMYLFSYRYTHRHVASFAASLVYVLNQWLFSQLTEAHVDILYSYALAPLIFILLDNALRTGKLKDILFFCGGLSLFATSFHPECIVIYGIFLLLFALFFVAYPTKDIAAKNRIRRLLKVSLPSSLIVFLFSAFFLLPFAMNVRSPYVHSSYEYPLEDAFSTSYANLTDAFTMRGVERWGYINVVDVYSQLGLPDFPVYTLLFWIFVLAFCVLLFRRDRYTVFFAVAILVSVFVAKGPYPPFGQAFVWAWFNVPHFAIFRAANRWVMMAILGEAFFVSLLVGCLEGFVENGRFAEIGERYFHVKIRENKVSKMTRVIVSIDAFNSLLKSFRRIMYALSIFLLIAIFLSGFLACFFFFSQGLQVYTPPKDYLAPYEWLSSQQDDYKVVTISRGPSEWSSDQSAQVSDFAFSAMQTRLGWSHDIGFDSAFIDDKPTLQDGGWNSMSRRFVDYLRFKLAREHLTDNMLKILGPFSYKYAVIPVYSTNSTRDFFLNQHGGQIIYDQTAIVLENGYASPRVFATNDSMLILGGLDSYDSLCKIGSFDPAKTPMYFVPLNSETDYSKVFASSGFFSFVNSDIMDLAMMSFGGNERIIRAGDVGASSINSTAYWIKMPSWSRIGSLVFGGGTLTTSGKNNITIPFRLGSNGAYDVWLRIGFASYRGKLTVMVDGARLQDIHPETSLWSRLEWVKAASLNLAQGSHSITFENDGTGYNDIDAVAIVEPSELETKIDKVMSGLQNFSGRILYLQSAKSMLLESSNTGWYWTVRPYTGYTIRLDDSQLNVAPLAEANASSSSDFLDAHFATDGDPCTRWVSEKNVLPQWLELSWNSVQELSGIRLSFEDAYASNYTVQTFDGASWIDQIAIVNNTLLDRFHEFRLPVQATKLRVIFTGHSLYDRISVWELQAYSTESAIASKNITIPREGDYMLAARVATGPNYGKINFKIGNSSKTILCNNSADQFEWHYAGPFSLQTGEQTISIGGAGPIELDEFLLYSLKEGENFISLDEIFNSPSPRVLLSYEIINPCTYKVHVNAEEPFTLVFSETYDSLWKAFIDNEEIPSITAYSLANSFRINKTGQFDLTIDFTGQHYADVGMIISTVSFTLTPILASAYVKRDRLKRCWRWGGSKTCRKNSAKSIGTP